jgi:hypothetical protein
MNNFFNRYKYHHRILKSIIEKDGNWFTSKEYEEKGIQSLSDDEYLSKQFNISIETVKEITSELKQLKCLRGITGENGEGYMPSEKADEYLNLRHFIYKRNKYIKVLIVPNIKDFLLIAVSVVAIVSFFNKLNSNKESIKLIEQEIIEVKSEQKSLKLELSKIGKTQKGTITD